MERYYQPEIECASVAEITALQDERLVKQVKDFIEVGAQMHLNFPKWMQPSLVS